jgi:hypothetical protein
MISKPIGEVNIAIVPLWMSEGRTDLTNFREAIVAERQLVTKQQNCARFE